METRVGGAGVATVVLTLHIAVGSAQRVNILDVHSACAAKIYCELIQLFIVGHPWRVNIDLVVTIANTTSMNHNFIRCSKEI